MAKKDIKQEAKKTAVVDVTLKEGQKTGSQNITEKSDKTTVKKSGKKSSTSPKYNATAAKARSGNPAKRGEVVTAVKEARKASQTVQPIKLGKHGVNKPWLIPTMVGLMIIGVLWVVIFYLTSSQGGYPIPAIQYWNLVVGFAFIIAGFGFSTKWK